MNILMLTNTFTPHVGCVARSVAETTRQLESLGHKIWSNFAHAIGESVAGELRTHVVG